MRHPLIHLIRGVAIVWALVILAPPVDALQIFFSGSPTDSRVGTVSPGPTNNHLYIWVVPTPTESMLTDISLNMRVDVPPGTVNVTDFSISNFPDRWTLIKNGTLNPSNRSVGAHGVPSGYIGLYKTLATTAVQFGGNGTGLGIRNGPGEDGTGASLLGTLTYDLSTPILTPVHLYLQVGGADSVGPGPNDASGGKMNCWNQTFGAYITPAVLFGAGDSSVSGFDKGAESLLPDATFAGDQVTLSIPPVPEPASLGLLGILFLAAGRVRCGH